MEAKRPAPPSWTIPEVAVVLAWLIPGAGHLYAGRVLRGLLFCLVLLGTFVTGAHASSLECVDLKNHRVAFIGQIGAGAPTLAALYLNRPTSAKERDSLVGRLRARYARERAHYDERTYNPYLDLGILYTALAGLLNLLVMQDAYEWARPPTEEED